MSRVGGNVLKQYSYCICCCKSTIVNREEEKRLFCVPCDFECRFIVFCLNYKRRGNYFG
jgi:hypothetical protein